MYLQLEFVFFVGGKEIGKYVGEIDPRSRQTLILLQKSNVDLFTIAIIILAFVCQSNVLFLWEIRYPMPVVESNKN